ncbi:unnamed protein product [Sphenostylis stenocarpa]|uniref:Enhancer of polycomb-like protein n=1 Tax=Sphenostylis stenocarpa TaxID=92480 RepID=A0AA86VUR3_9FABA|nr:unnamed protein product [Sphenostylis stenocarpa]
MESRAENSNGTTVPKKSKSLDLKSLYKSKLSVKTAKENLKRIRSSSGDGDEKRKRKKARKEVSLSSLENGEGSSELKLGVSQRLSSSMLNRVSFSVGGDDFHIPKRKRSFMGRKKSEPGQASNLVEQHRLTSGYDDPVQKLGSEDISSGVESFKIKHKKEFDEFKENRNSDSNSVQHFKENGDCVSHSVVNSGGDSSLTKSRRKNRKRKTSALDITNVSNEVEPLVSNCKISDDLQEDEEENLEENAARMLSSRFDPSCTGFSIKGSNGLSYFQSSSQSVVNHGLKSQSGSESTSADTDGRVLRPRKQYKSRGNSRKRRHFYEILLGDVDVYWVLNRKIKIFWPLDQSWYYGRVDGYDEGSKLYHIKYDDRDVEWVNLHTERFKLLLHRSEVPENAKGERAIAKCRSSDHQKGIKSRKERQRTEENPEDDHCGGSSMDSEPIISWLSRSTHRLRSSFQGIKKQKTSVTLTSTMPSFLYDEPVTTKAHLSKSSLKGIKNNLSSDYVSQDKLSDDFRMTSSLQSATCNKDGKQPIVYFRRRIRKPAPISPHIYEEKHAILSASGSVSLDHMFSGAENMKRSSDARDEAEGPLCFTYKAGVSKVFWDMESALLKFGLNFPICFDWNDSFQSENLWLLYPLFLLQYGTVMTKWPRVCLEMLFVDNVVGLRFLLFEGCLSMAVAFVFFVLGVFQQPSCQEKYVDSQFPCTSIGFKFSGLHVIKKPLVFEFYNFSGVRNSKWMGLDSKLKRHCLLSKQLHLSECTYDNIQALQNGSIGFSITSISRSSSVKVMRKSRPGINIMGVSKVSTQADTHQCSDVGESKLPPFTLSFAAAPTFFLSFHLKLLMEQSATHISFCDHAPVFDQEDPSLVTNGCASTDGCSNKNSEITPRKDIEILSNGAAVDGGSCADLDHPSTFCDQTLSQNYLSIGHNGAGISISHFPVRLGATPLPKWQSHHFEQDLGSLHSSSLLHQDKAADGSHSFIGDLSIQIPAVDQFEKPGCDGDLCDPEHSPDFSWNINVGVMPSSNPTARRSSWYQNQNSSSSLGFQSHVWSDDKADSLYSDFRNGPRRPRTQVSYSVPSAGYEFSSRQRNHHQKGLPHKRIRKASEKKSSDVTRGPEKNFECLSCRANVLITLGSKGWRESGAHIVLELFDHNEWRLSVKLSGITRYSYKAHQFLQPGSTNRFTHAMMWKGGKDWILEFPNRSQWALFKEMHEECYKRNIRAASVKNIPIPGVHLIEENDDNGCDATIVRSCMYFQQVETDVEMALDPSRVLYDMDSEDEQWIANAQNSEEDNTDLSWISEEMFEKTIDMFEKAAYAKKREHFTSNEIEELMVDVGPLCIMKIIYDHWQQRRKKKGMALIRHFQPPQWELYQTQAREWEVAITKSNAPSNACMDKVTTLEKPAMFAFCLKPRGLESLNKGLKHRSQKKISVSGHANSNLDQDGFRRRHGALPFGGEKFLYQGHNFDCFDESSLALTSPRVFLPRDAGSLKYHPTNGSGYRNHVPKFHQSRYELPHNRHHLAGPKRQGIEHLDASVLEELRLRDAVAEANIKRHVAKLKRDRAKRLLYKADVAIHKAMTALMIAEAMNASELGEMKASED